jgi:8-oxo-dGTP pyrophosphatase MutT (NUDIX family)
MTTAAATLVVTYNSATGIQMVLTRRPMNLRRHPGQIAFPGGMIEPTDASEIDAAMREAGEEIGLRIVGKIGAVALTPVETFTSGIIIHPYLIQLIESPRLRADPNEVEEILRVPVAALRAPGAHGSIAHPGRPGGETMAYRWNGAVIWGATATTIDEVLRIYSSSDIRAAKGRSVETFRS